LLYEDQFPGRQGRLLFAYMVCNRHRPMTREELAEVLWPESLPRAWETALSAVVSKVRGLLKDVGTPGSFSVSSAFGCYVLRIADDVWIDREAAAEAIDETEGLIRAGEVKKAWPLGHIASINARQSFLPGEEGDWISRERARSRNILVRSLDCMSEIWMANEEPGHALGAASESVDLEPYRETGYQRLMRLHLALGNRAEALRVYERCRSLLADELGADPSPETQAIYFELLGTP
jgi:DNA-binding SARP family transcriptional activator